MKRINEFIKRLEELCKEFDDLPAEDIGDELEYKASQYFK